MDKKTVDELAYRWVAWTLTRRYYIKPMAGNILARFQPRERAPVEPDARLDSFMPFFNGAIWGLLDAGTMNNEATCFLGLYFYAAPLKEIEREQKCAHSTVYERARKFGAVAYTMAKALQQIAADKPIEKCSILAIQNN